MFKLFIYTIIFFRKIIFSKIFFYLFQNSLNFIKILFKTKIKSFNLYFLLDLLSLLIVCKQIEKKKSDLAIISLNAFAHYQHNYWDEKKYEFYYFWYLNKIIEQCQIIEKKYNSVIIFNGFSQKKIKPLYYLRPKNIKNFLDMLNIKFLKAEQNMTTGVTVFFDRKIEIMQIYQSELGEHPFPRSDRNIESLATFRGASVGVNYAESFQIIKIIDK
jgi:hypothetical protein